MSEFYKIFIHQKSCVEFNKKVILPKLTRNFPIKIDIKQEKNIRK